MVTKEQLMEVIVAPGGAVDTLATFATIVFGIVAAYYIFSSAANAKALRKIGYDKAWLAWVPYLRYWAIADATKDEGHSTKIYGRYNIPNTLYTLWFALLLVVNVIDGGLTAWIPATLGTIIDIIIMGLLLGGAYAKVLARITNKPERECFVFGMWSGVFPIVAAIRFCYAKPVKTIEEENYGLEIENFDNSEEDLKEEIESESSNVNVCEEVESVNKIKESEIQN